ncbi:MBL fold metallo-hydrolase [Thermus filiformis]|jgi:glyoxylase-like metal-dependent hydrolase (beta-lactamase superfamily II)|uniref:Hydrolase n=1 Tax=Thermus filiformis TaxID=276 RepID=A0A0A2WVA5_THEFI|nr:MBL fold metallo-hydrolase [Thermus filiformis]KGQ22687.1 hydrolase [Thermus filiformis]
MTELLPGLYQIPVPIPYPLKTVNLYLLKGKEEVALVDTALGTRAARGSLELALAELGLCFSDVKAVLLTHHHPDHYGLSGFFEAQGARVYLHEEELLRGHLFWKDRERFRERSLRLFLEGGMPLSVLEGIEEEMAKTYERVHPPQNPIPLQDGQTLEVAGFRLRVVWTPGHADGHVVFLAEEGWMLGGDLLLERVSPNIGLWAYTRENPLEDFLRSLDKVAEVAPQVVFAGHFGPVRDPKARAKELRAHHEARLSALLALLEEPKTPWDLSLALFPGDLTPAQRRFAFAETLAHLEYLRHQGLLTRQGQPLLYARA